MSAVWIVAAGVFLAVAAGLVAGSLWFNSYLRSRQFLEMVSGLTGKAFRSDARIEPLRWTGSSAFSEKVVLVGRAGSAVREASASQVRAELNWRAAFDGAWRVDGIEMTQFNGDFAAPAPAAFEPAPAARQPTGLASLLPSRFEIGQVKVGAANISFGAVRASGMHLLAMPDGRGWRFEGSGGTLATPSLPAIDISSFRAREQGGDYFLLESALRLGESGKISATGESASGGILRVTWDGVRSKDVLSPAIRKSLDGALSGSAEVRPDRSVRGKVQLRDGVVENVPALALVADFTNNPSFRRMSVQEMSSDFSFENGLLVLTNFEGESKGLLRVEGTGQLRPDGTIAGRFQIGVTAQTLQWLPGSRERVFTVARNGYLWTDIVLGGTFSNPTEDLSPRLTAAMGGAIIEKGAGLIKEVPTRAIDGAKSILDGFLSLPGR